MNQDFWFKAWENNDIGFHRSDANPVLVQHFRELALPQNSRVFLPMCGKTLDIAWLLNKGYRVAGAELVEVAVEQLIEGLGTEPKISKIGAVTRWSARNIDIFVGDIFYVTREVLGSVDAVYDRAALVAWPKEMRGDYTSHLIKITDAAPQLLVTYEYDQNLMEGPPFSISKDEVNQYYGDRYEVSLAGSADVRGGLKRKYAARKDVWVLRPKKEAENLG